MKACLLVLAFSLAASVVAPDTGTLFVLRVISGAAAGGVIPLSLALLGDRVPMAEREIYTHDQYLSPFTWRYGSPRMRSVWSEVNKRRTWRRKSVAAMPQRGGNPCGMVDANHPITDVSRPRKWKEGAMPSLWSELWRRWLEPSPEAGIEHLNERLRRDIGLLNDDVCSLPAAPIRHRNLSELRIFCTLQAYR